MIKHCIVVASAYSIGTRIALDYCDEDLKLELLEQKIDYIIKECGEDISISTHFIQTESKNWKSVVETDKFFKDVKLISTEQEYVKILLADRDLIGLDVAKYILTKIPCTHLKLEKLVYMCYADYLCCEGKKLFEDKIYAYRLGPVVKSVYTKFKRSGFGFLSDEDNKKLYNTEQRKMPIQSRIIASKDGVKKLSSIDATLEVYGKMTASELVDLTHSSLGPWECSGSGKCHDKEITDELIKKYHQYEIKEDTN